MGFLKRLFGGASEADKQAAPETRRESDNLGLRQSSLQEASAYWMTRLSTTKRDPFALYIFERDADARAALLDMPYIHEAVDTGNLICSEVLLYGYYQAENGKYEAIICGEDLSLEMWERARQSFHKYGGVVKNEQAPENKKESGRPKSNKHGEVVFLREEKMVRGGSAMTYRIHEAPDAETAKAFLLKTDVSEPLCYVIVETPDGNYGRDIQGIYKE